MITAVHALIYSEDAEATRTFLRDVLQWPSVEDPSSGAGWLIFRTGPGELGVHPTVGMWEGEEYSHPPGHRIALMCDDLSVTMGELAGRGAAFTCGPEDMGFGVGVMLQLPGAEDILLYEPRHPTAYGL
ncbi:VOC family protein [Arthrobacter sp. Marseille-P9274]|uniref:VOC family protein n=1 Tax=Arthrobacter sp. Marseille-P9274 TaxID=2866572 RepID=UPI0021C7F713|nr:VOC family protein [Arthrobacter sp. Marseille-P9274]